MYFSMSDLDGPHRNKLLHSTVVPRPIAWISSLDATGSVNVAPFSFFNLMSGDPPLLAVCIGSRAGVLKDTGRNIAARGEFVVNLVSMAQLKQMNVTAIDFDEDVDEANEAGLELLAGHAVSVPRIAGSPASLECRNRTLIDIDGRRTLVIADIVGMHLIDAAVLDAKNLYVDPEPMDLVARLHNPGWYCRIENPFRLTTPTVEEWNALKQTGEAQTFLGK
ncbi:flavin reductase family protein [Paraburkholderia sp. BCC1886]|uniref:flavin reductase family protein n=1 Tax=Paraburkholderia sp. BCC1886 TaxID=2562670 RepID=UPI00118337B0|nr:flavin reductase family protein [Paraburkholderia sp. BCC1886]